MLFRIAMFAIALASALLPVQAGAATRVWPGADWETASPESQGMSSQALASLLAYASLANVDSVLVTRNGRIVAEAYYAPYEAGMKHRINSSTKAVIGALAGIAVNQGLLDPAAPVAAQLGATGTDAQKQAITLQHLLDQTSGIAWEEPLTSALPKTMIEMGRSRDWVRFVLERPMAQAPGAGFNYSSGNSQLASALIASKAGMSTREFAMRHLFEPIGVRDLRWGADPQGVNLGGYGIYMSTRDMARFGYLYLNHGEWNGRQVVPRAWVDKAFNAKVAMQPMAQWRYADGWWTLPSRKATLAVGYSRQLIVLLPEHGVVAALTGRAGYPFEDVVDKLIAAVRSADALPSDAQGEQQLREQIARAAAPPPLPVAQVVPAAGASRTYSFTSNPMRMRTLAFDFSGDGSYRLDLEGEAAAIARPLGFKGWSMAAPIRGEVAYSRAAWASPDKLAVEVRWPEEARHAKFEFAFSGKQVDVTYTPMLGQAMRFSGEALD